jgi:hypothetical protein
VDAPKGRSIIPVVKAFVYEVLPDRINLHRHVRVKADIWIDSYRFWFPEVSRIDPKDLCSADVVAKVKLGKGRFQGKQTPFVDAAFARAAPAGVVASAAVSVRADLPAPDPDGVRSFSFRLQPVLALDARYHTVITFPLGSDVLGMEGPPPTMQRLFRGHLAYYWEHAKTMSEVTVRFRPAARVREELDLKTLNP